MPRGTVTQQYISILDEICSSGASRPDRTGVGSRFITGAQIVVEGIFPIVTSKRVLWKNAIAELLWMISGSTNTADLVDGAGKRLRIWDVNRKNYAARHPYSAPGELGPIYGQQWREFGQSWAACDECMRSQSPVDDPAYRPGRPVDQLKMLVDGLRKDPNSRRHMVTAYDPCTSLDAALPPCIPFFQVVHRPDESGGALDMIVTQRSADCLLGLPFNLVQYGAMQAMLAHLTGMRVGKYVHNIGDAHVYNNHLDTVREMITHTQNSNDDFVYEITIADRGQKYLTDFDHADFDIVSAWGADSGHDYDADDHAKKYDDVSRPLFTGAIN